MPAKLLKCSWQVYDSDENEEAIEYEAGPDEDSDYEGRETKATRQVCWRRARLYGQKVSNVQRFQQSDLFQFREKSYLQSIVILTWPLKVWKQSLR